MNIFKKYTAAFAAAAMLAAAMLAAAIPASAANFTDIDGHWAEDTIIRLADNGIIDGYSDTEFQPDGTVTRAQYLKMIMEATNVEPTEYRAGECLEATSSDWYAPYLQKAIDCALIPDEMIAGYKAEVSYEVDDEGTATSSKVTYTGAFNGTLPITREEMAVLTQYFYQYTRTILTNEDTVTTDMEDFTDSDKISDWAVMSIKRAVANGFIEGMDDGSFAPDEYATRAQAAVITERVMDTVEAKSVK